MRYVLKAHIRNNAGTPVDVGTVTSYKKGLALLRNLWRIRGEHVVSITLYDTKDGRHSALYSMRE